MQDLTIGVAAFLTSILSAVAGLGGGVILLTVLAQFFVPTTAIPIQGAIQLIANGSRSFLLREHVSWPVAWRASVLLLPFAFVGAAVATSLPDDALRVALAGFVLVVAWRPQLLRRATTGGHQLRGTYAIGAATGFLNTTVGVSGPFTSPFFKAVTATHVSFVATAATQQVLAHLSKLVSFGFQGFNPADHISTIAVGIVGVVAGTAIGTRLLGRFSEEGLATLFRIVLTVLAVRILVLVVLP